MKKIIIIPSAIVMLAFMLLACGCKKSTPLIESWTWKGVTYTSSSCSVSTSSAAGYGSATTLTVQDGSNTLEVIFNGGLPSPSLDTVVAWGGSADATQLTISLGVNGVSYQSTGGNGSNQTVTVTKSGSNIEATALPSNPIELLNIASGSVDSAGLYFTIIQ